MDEKQIIQGLKSLKNIKPNKDWAVLAKSHVFERERNSEQHKANIGELVDFFRFLFSHKYAFSSLACLVIVLMAFNFSQKAMPGEKLFALKKTLEQTKASLLSESEKSRAAMEQANKRLDDLTKIAQTNKTKKLAPAITEYQASVSAVAESLKTEGNEANIKEIASGVKQLQTKEREIKSLGVEIEESVELDVAMVEKITKEILVLMNQDLDNNQRAILSAVETDCQNGNFADALEKIMQIKSQGN